jgi:uncharacterized phage protein (predicted DNA packaging)
MIALEDIKEYLRVDGDEEDNLLARLEKFSREEIENATGVVYTDFDNSETYELAQLVIIADRYENRASQDQEFVANNILSSLYMKLKSSVI